MAFVRVWRVGPSLLPPPHTTLFHILPYPMLLGSLCPFPSLPGIKATPSEPSRPEPCQHGALTRPGFSGTHTRRQDLTRVFSDRDLI